LCAVGVQHPDIAFVCICVHSRLFAVKMLLTFKIFRGDSSGSEVGFQQKNASYVGASL